MGALIFAFSLLRQAQWDVGAWFYARLVAVINHFTSSVESWVSAASVWLKAQLPQAFFDFFEDPVIQSVLVPLIEAVLYFIPLPALFLIFASAMGICAIIRLVRWILALIPTIGG